MMQRRVPRARIVDELSGDQSRCSGMAHTPRELLEARGYRSKMDSQIRAALRTYPLYDFDIDRVRVRAYFLAEANPIDSVQNWLEAERTELIEQAGFALGFYSGAGDFLRDYRLVDHVRFRTNEPRPKEFRGDRRRKFCTICGLSAPAVRFRTEPHLLPACTGNRYLYTAEECDSCNLSGGADAETELGKMLAAHRAMAGIQTRSKPSTTLSVAKGASSIGGQARDEPLQIALVEGSDTVTVEDVGSNTLRITADVPKYRPVTALRSLGRSAWHLLTDNLKHQHQAFLSWVRGTAATAPVSFLEGFIPGPGLLHTTFAVWAKERGAGPALVSLLAFGNTIVIVPSQEDPTVAIPVPPLPRSPFGDVKMVRFRWSKDDPVAPKLSYEIGYTSRYLHSLARPEQALLQVLTERGTVSVDCEVSVVTTKPEEPVTSDILEITLTGGQLRGTLHVTGVPLHVLDDGTVAGGCFSVAHELDAGTVGDASLTAAFLEALALGGTLRITQTRDRQQVVDDIVLPPLPPSDADAVRAAIRRQLG